MANVSSNGIRGCAAEIDNVISITQSTADKTQEVCNEISSANEILQSYDNAIVKGSHGFIKKYSKVNDQNGWVDKEYVNRWKITGLDTSGTVNALNEMANEVSNIVSTLKSEVASIEEIATAIDGYIGSINAQLSDLDIRSITPEILANAYLAIGKDGVAKTNLATNGEDINNRNFIDYNDIKDNGLSNTRLTFVLQDDGSYRVYSNGKETEFYTTGLAAAFYQKTLKREVQKTYSSKSGNNQTNSSKSGNRNIGTKNTDNTVTVTNISTETLPNGNIQTTTTYGKSKVIVTKIPNNTYSQVCLNDSGEKITPSDQLINTIKNREDYISNSSDSNFSKYSSTEMVNQDGSIQKYYYDSNNKNQLLYVMDFDKEGVGTVYGGKCSKITDNYIEKFSQISNLKEGNTRRYLNSNGNCFFETGIAKNGTDALG